MKIHNRILYTLLRPLAALFLWLKFGYRYKVAQDLPENYIVLSNHTTDFDFLMVACSFPQPMLFVGSEHIARWKLLYKFITTFFGFITRPKGSTASSTVLDILRALRGGSRVCLFAEGSRCWDGVTGPILPATGKMVQRSKCALVTYRIEGGYFASPRWAGAASRRGRVLGAPVNVYTAEQLAQMSADEINAAICRDLHEDAYQRQAADPAPYRGKKLAEKLESAVFICPFCGAVDSLHSENNTTSCSKCGGAFRYDQHGMLTDIPFETIKELLHWQRQQVAEAAAAGVVYTAAGKLCRVENHTEQPLTEGTITMDAEALCCSDYRFPLSSLTHLDIHGRWGLVFSTRDGYYELKIDSTCNALKFFLLFSACKPLNAISQ